jgi:hypothetical protein
VRLHPDEENFWSPELCFVNVPVQGSKKDLVHLIDEDIAADNLSNKKIKRYRLALAAKPFDIFFLCIVPTQNIVDNSWNVSTLQACEQAKTRWTSAVSRKEEGYESYKIEHARNENAFPAPKWPATSLEEIISTSFHGRMIESHDHPGLLRLVGAST